MLESREAAKILEDIVGEDNFSEDPAIISSYTFAPGGSPSKLEAGKDLFDIDLGGVILPGSTEEVQAIVKVCNRYKIVYKALSTGMFHVLGASVKKGLLRVDMRRMNRIVKLDDKNMYAVVEPYVSGIVLEVEAMKKGLICHIIGAGSHTSPLASVTSAWGHGHSAYTTSHSGRICLGAEWVLPTGEVVRWGPVEEGKTAHPGPGLSGMYRGGHGAFGALGIFTKVAIKLDPWPGPPHLEKTGRNPTPGFKIPDNMKVYLLAFPDEEKLADAVYKLTNAQIAYHIWHHPLFMHPQRWMSESNDGHYEVWEKLRGAGMIEKSLNELTLIIAAHSKKELKYKEKVMEDIMRETGAEEFLPGFLSDHDMERFLCAQICVHKPATEFRIGAGDLAGGWGQILTWDDQMTPKKALRKLHREYNTRGILNDVAGESCWGGPMEQRALGHTEYVHFTDPRNLELRKAQSNFPVEAVELAIKENLLGTGPIALTRIELEEKVSKHLGNYLVYKKAIKKALDPNDVSESSCYI